MARSLTYRQIARNFTNQAETYDRLAKKQNDEARAMERGAAASSEQLKAAIAMFDQAIRSYYTADSMEAQAEAYNVKADEAGEDP
jgi:hypothetical protein